MEDNTIYSAIIEVTRDNAVLAKWKALHEKYRSLLIPNKKSGQEILDYITGKYPLEPNTSAKLKKVVEMNARENHAYLPDGLFDNPESLNTRCFTVKNVGLGKLLYDNQQQDYKDYISKIREYIPDAEDMPAEEFPIPILIGIEMHSGYVHTEGSPALSNELTMFCGLNEKELEHIYLVAHYIELLQSHNRLHEVLSK